MILFVLLVPRHQRVVRTPATKKRTLATIKSKERNLRRNRDYLNVAVRPVFARTVSAGDNVIDGRVSFRTGNLEESPRQGNIAR